MKHLKRLLLLLSVPVIVRAQSENSNTAINWATGLSWQQIIAKAKKENKYIFVDAYATWCKPCKEMDLKVYTVDSVGDFLNKGFISVKVQMDQTKNDDAATKSWYNTATYMTKEYNLNAYPTMLFFTPAGEIATKEVGFKDPAAFIATAKNAKDPSKQFYVLLKNYKKGKLDDAAKRSLINTAKQLGDTVNYRALRENYFAYLHALPKEKLYTKDNIAFIASIISRRSQPVFDMFYPDGMQVDKLMGKQGYARKVVDDVIMKEKIAATVNAAMESKVEPDWKTLYSSIVKDYNNDYAERNILEAKQTWYYYGANDMAQWASAINDKIEKYGTDTVGCSGDGTLNNQASIIWDHLGSTAKPDNKAVFELNRTCGWMEAVVRRAEFAQGWCRENWSKYIDTYANLLYKVGRTDEAIKWEQLAIVKEKEVGGNSKDLLEFYQDRVDKMKKGEHTWPVIDETK